MQSIVDGMCICVSLSLVCLFVCYWVFSLGNGVRSGDDLGRRSNGGGGLTREDLLGSGGDLGDEDGELGVLGLDEVPLFDELDNEFSDALELRVFLDGDGELAGEEFDLLGQVDELFFEGLSVSEGQVEFGLLLVALDALVAVESFEFCDSLSEECVVLFAFLEFLLEESVVVEGEFKFGDALSEGIDFLGLLDEDFGQSLDFFVDALELAEVDLELRDFLSELHDDSVLFDVRLFSGLESLGQIFDLLGELEDLVFEELLFTERALEVTFTL